MQAKAFFNDGIINVFLNLKVGNARLPTIKAIVYSEHPTN